MTRTRLREHRWPWLAIVAVLVVGTAAVMTLSAGGRRAQSVYPRFLDSQNAHDVVVTVGAGIGLADLDVSRVAALPHVVESATVPVYFSLGRTGAGRLIPPRVIASQVADERVFAGGLDRVKILKGRAADPDRPDEVVADFSLEEAYGVVVGSDVDVRFTTPGGLPRLFGAINNATPEALDVGPLVRFHVVGLGVIPGQLPPISSGGLPSMWMTPAWERANAATLAHTDSVGVKLRQGEADVNAFKSAVEEMAAGRPVLFFTQRDSTAAVLRSFRSQAISLYILAGLLALVVVLFVSQALARQAWVQAGDVALVALGMTRRQRTGALALQGLLGGLLGGTIGAAAAFALSRLMPLGLARIADPAPGPSFDVVVLGGGVLLTVAVTGALAALRGWLAERHGSTASQARDSTRRPLRSSLDWLPVGAWLGFRQAFRSGGDRDARSVGAMGGITLGLVTVIATVVFSASLRHLISTPHLWGATWQARLGDGFAPDVEGRVAAGLLADPWVRNVAAGTAAQLELDDRVRVDAFAMDVVRGEIGLAALEGRGPTAADEIFLGTAALRSLGAEVGQSVKVSIGPRSSHFRVVGRGPLPLGAFRDAGLSAMISFEALGVLAPEAQPNIYLVDGPVGTAPSDAAAYLAARHPGIGVFPHELPTDFANFGRVERLPLASGAVLATLAVLSLMHALVMTSRARVRDFAVLKSLGFVPGQVAGVVIWQAAALVAGATLVALPMGLIAGRLSWNTFAEWIGALAVPIVPPLQVAGVATSTLLIAAGVATLPAQRAARVKPAAILRAD